MPYCAKTLIADRQLQRSIRAQDQSQKHEWDTAYHEAGHAVAAFFLGLRIGRSGVTIIPDKTMQTVGTAHVVVQSREDPDVSMSPHTHVQIENRAAMCLAGDVAEKRFNSRRRYGGHKDLQQAADLLGYISGSIEINKARLNVALLQARNLVELRWTEISAVATTLVEHKKLTAEQVLHEIYSSQQRAKK